MPATFVANAEELSQMFMHTASLTRRLPTDSITSTSESIYARCPRVSEHLAHQPEAYGLGVTTTADSAPLAHA